VQKKALGLRARLGTLVTVLVATVAITALAGGWGLVRLRAELDDVFGHRLPATTTLLEADRDLHQLLVAERTLLSVPAGSPGADKLRQDYETNLQQADDRIAKVLKVATPEEAEILQAYTRSRGAWLERSRATLAGDIGARTEASLGGVAQAFDAMREHINKLTELHDAAATAANVRATSIARRSLATFVLLTIGGVAFGALATWHLLRWLGRHVDPAFTELLSGASQVAAASTELASSSQHLSKGSTEQAAALEEASASMEEMASMTRQNAENTHRAEVLTTEAEALIRSANTALGEMVGSMNAIKESSEKVSKIIKTIDEIAFQTNILALNAAVEAARAGDAGMGFAVVADEVRALAQRSAQAARDTTVLIEESVARSAEGEQKVAEVTRAIASVTASSAGTKQLIQEVSEASRQQTQGIEQVTHAVAQMEKVTQTTAATAEESAAASEELSAQADMSMEVVARLAALIGGAAGKPAVRVRTAALPAAPATPAKPRLISRRAASQELPLESTGTFGRF
jgi:methyl-accepting chemotaxis protein